MTRTVRRTMRFDAAAKLLAMTVGKCFCAYKVERLPHDGGLRAYRLTKCAEFREDGEPDNYDVVLGGEAGAACECKGFLRWGHCKHLDAVKVLIGRGSI